MNEVICDRVGVAPIEEKLVQHGLRWLAYPAEASRSTGGGDEKGVEGLECA